MATNATVTNLHTLMQYNNCDITLTFTDQHDSPCLTVCYVHQHFRIYFLREASTEIFEDADSALLAIEQAIQRDANTPPK